MDTNTTENQSPVTPTQNISFLGRVAQYCFSSKGSSFLWIVISNVVFNFIGFGIMGSSSGALLGTPLTSLGFFICLAILLSVTGYKKEANNILKAFGLIVLICTGLLIIGFGLCMLALSGFGN